MEQPKLGAVKPLAFFNEVKTELSKVVWPTREQTLRLTAVVIAISVAIGIFIGALDLILTKAMELLLKK